MTDDTKTPPPSTHLVGEHGFIGTREQLANALYECGERNGATASAICKTAADLILAQEPNIDARAEDLAGRIWAYFDRTGGATATRWFNENKTLDGPAHIIELCRKALTPSPQPTEKASD